MKKKGFTLIELLAVIIILAIIALIATPIVLDVVDNAKESARQSSVNGYADSTRMAIYDYQFANNGKYPIVNKTWADNNSITKGEKVECEEVYFSESFDMVLHKCHVGTNTKEYCHASGKTYEDCENEEYKSIYSNLGNVVISGKPVVEELKKQYNESNTTGLLKDDTGYYYKGTNEEVSNNFIWFGGHLWRVISIDNDNNLTMITQQPITAIQPASSVWTTEEQYKNSYINTWLNEVFLGSMNDTDKSRIQDNVFNIGVYNNVSEITTTQKVGLLDEEQYTKAGLSNSFLGINTTFWLGNRYDSSHFRVTSDGFLRNDYNPGSSSGVRAVIKISDLAFTEGVGTLSNPYREKSTTTNTSNIKVGEYISVPTSGTGCGEDNRCLLRVVSKDNDSIKVILNGLLPNKSEFDTNNNINTAYTKGNTIDTILATFANTIDNQYRYTGNKSFNIGSYPYVSGIGQDYKMVQETKYTGTEEDPVNVGLPVVGEMLSGNDIDVGTDSKKFVNINTIENPAVSSYFWAMNALNTSNVCVIDLSSSLNYCDPRLSNVGGVRPVLFLKNNLTFTSGEGTAENPFLLGE